LTVILTSALLAAEQQKPVVPCREPDVRKLSATRVKSFLDKTERIQAPCCAHMLHIRGKITLTISVDSDGAVTCVALVSGHPLIVSHAIDSVKSWKFRPYVERGLRQGFRETISLRYNASE
jgi:outer membrane biosynthesis protein TonB